MNRRIFQTLTWLMWLALPLLALRYWQVWDQLPLRMATHFDINGDANGWMTRDMSLWFALGVTVFLLAVSTAILLVIHSQKTSDAASWSLLAFFYFIVGFVFFGNEKVMGYNLHGTAAALGSSFILVPLAIVIFLAVFLGSNRGEALVSENWIAEETHSSPLLAFVLLLPLLVELWVLSTTSLGAARLPLILICIFLVAVAAFAGSGFRYYFSPAGVEIRTLGYRLRSISASQITSYAIEPWNILRGYGIRGVGRTRAYVWSNKVVHIKTQQGEVFLGHNEPERIMRDLDMITQAGK
jgi:Domain of unknown function (DUF1648)